MNNIRDKYLILNKYKEFNKTKFKINIKNSI